MTRKRLYLPHKVDDELEKRLAFIFDRYENVVVSISGGKDSTVLWHAATREAERRGRKVHLFFLDQEAEYQATIDLMREMMDHPAAVPHWYQVPIRMTNAVSYLEPFLHSWDPKASNSWMRQKEPGAIKDNPFEGVDRFYDFIDAFERSWPGDTTAFLVGIRSEESLHRYAAVTRNPGLPGVDWCTNRKGRIVFYPISHFTFEDVFIYIRKHQVPFNSIYSKLYLKGEDITGMRVSYLMHEKSFSCLGTLQEFEPDTYERLLIRAPGIETAARLAGEPMGFSTVRRPPAFATWLAYREHLLDTVPDWMKDIFVTRFARQLASENVHRQQCRQILIGDWENNVPVVNKTNDGDRLKKWKDIL